MEGTWFLNRLFKIVYFLLENGKSTAPELAEKCEVSIRTIYRDLDAISDAGIPIYATPGKGGGIFLSDDYILDKSMLSEKEKEQMLMALQGLSATGEEKTDELLSKLSALFHMKSTDWIEVDFSGWVKNAPGQDIFAAVKQAVLDRHIISFSYFNSKGVLVSRSVQPVKLIFKSGDWYLYGFCLLRNDHRFFKLTRMKDLIITEETFIRKIPDNPEIKTEIQSYDTVSVDLKFSPQAAFRVYDEFTSVTKDREDNLYVTVDLPDNEIMYSYLLTFGDHVEVLSPKYVREEIIKKLEMILKKYKT